jgi:hypothetical protein
LELLSVFGCKVVVLRGVEDVDAVGAEETSRCCAIIERFQAIVSTGFRNDRPDTMSTSELVV